MEHYKMLCDRKADPGPHGLYLFNQCIFDSRLQPKACALGCNREVAKMMMKMMIKCYVYFQF